jgi:beta-galactosidase
MLYITDRRNTVRHQQATAVKVYSTRSNVKLMVNGVVVNGGKTDDFHTTVWHKVTLQKGKNKIEVSSVIDGKLLRDSCEWTLEN